MKSYKITNLLDAKIVKNNNYAMDEVIANGMDGLMQVSDGYHTMDELYDHRITLYIALARVLRTYKVWRSKTHSDGSVFEGWFLLGINVDAGKQITYHLPLDRWDECDFAKELDMAPEFDGHTPKDVLERIKKIK